MQRVERTDTPEDAAGRRRKRRTAALLAALAIAGLGVVLAGRWRREPRPNIVLVVIDTLRRDSVGAYGYARPTTPFLDSLARGGVLFENGWSHAPQTLNSTAALFTSQIFPLLRLRYVEPPTGGQQKLPIPLGIAESNLTLAEALAAGGYATAAVFTNPHHFEASSFAQGFARWRYLRPAREELGYATAAEVNDAFRDLVREADPDRPLFAYVHYMDVHHPYRPPPELAQRFVTVSGEDKYVNGRPAADRVPKENDLRFMRDSYDASIRYVDDHVRDLLRSLERHASRPTILVVTSDHGEEFMEHGGLGHGHSTYPELLRIPLILHGGSLPQGTRVRRLARGIDVAPTIVALSRGEAPEGFEGRSLLPFVGDASAGDERLPGRPSDDPEGLSFAWHGALRGLTFDRLHLAVDLDHRERVLFDAETEHRFARAAGAGAGGMRRLERRLRKFERRLIDGHRRAVSHSPEEASSPLPPHTAAQLRALGYVE